ncbi:MAG: phosphoribosylamine--glycine ligase [Lentisphaeria bacterium]|nr:phosphoribosylamine--glycine ligase [Lentisphaeria bacterium]
MKKVLVIGSGGREHALVWQLKNSPQVEKVYCAPGNAGIAKDAECVNIKVDELDKLADFAKNNAIDFTVVGPEAPLCAGVVDVFKAQNLAIFGPDKVAAQLEGSKDFAKQFMVKYNIPTAAYATFDNADDACKYIDEQFTVSKVKGIVVKADGLAAGKGVLVAENCTGAKDFVKECFNGAFGSAGTRVVIEEMLTGEEASILALTDGKTIIPLVSSQDHKRIFDRDRGPNTGGMGAYSPAPVVTKEVSERIDKEILQPFLKGINEEQLNFRGVIFCGLMIEDGVPKVLEFNVRFGDPEIQPVMRRFEGDWYDVLYKTATGELDKAELKWSKDAAISVVLASGGYPGKYENGFEITGLDKAAETGAVVFHCGTAEKDGKIVTASGRVLGVSATGSSIRNAIYNAYYGVRPISFKDMFYRKDIGMKALRRPGTVIKSKAKLLMLFLFFAVAGTLLVYPWADQLPAKFANWEQITIVRAAVLLFALLRMGMMAVRKKLTYRLYSVVVMTFLFIWLITRMFLMPYSAANFAGSKTAAPAAQSAPAAQK